MLLRRTITWALSLFIAGGFASGILSMVEQGFPEAGRAVAGGAHPVQMSLKGTQRLDAEANDREDGRINVLVLGIDRRPVDAEELPSRTDAIMLISADPVSRSAAVLSIPRDLWVPIPVGGDLPVVHDRINAAAVLGETSGYPGGGIGLTRATVEYNLGVRVHRHVVFDFVAFERIIDRLGGLPVDLGRPLVDEAFPTGDYGAKRVALPAGRQQLTGEQALWYARSRYRSSDFDRMHRQQELLMAARQRFVQVDVLPKLPGLWEEFRDAVRTDIPLDELLRLARLAQEIDPDRVVTRSLDLSHVSRATAGGDPFALVPNRSSIADLIHEVIPPEAPDEGDPKPGVGE